MKKKIVALALVICMLAIAIVGGTLAYFTDTADQTNTFTAGKVGIKLDEATIATEPDAEGNLVAVDAENNRTEDDQEYKLFPAMTIAKDPTITVAEGSENAYIAAKVIIKGDLLGLIPMDGVDGNININAVAKGGLLNATPALSTDLPGLSNVFATDEAYIYQEAAAAGKEWTLYVFIKAPKAAEASVTLFETLNIPANWNNAEMAKINNMTIKVEAYATQTNGFADCFKAMYTAFPTAFPFAPTNP